MKTGMVFPGQGAQYVGMGKDLYDAYAEARELYKSADRRFGVEFTDLCFSGDPDELTQTRNAQPAILLHSIAVLTVLEGMGVSPSAVTGHSLGEFSALVAAGAIAPMDAVEAVRRRGELMYEVGLRRLGAMAVIVGLESANVEDVLTGWKDDGEVVVANYTAPLQQAISGDAAAVDAAVVALKDAGAKRAVKLGVSGAFHSPLMEPVVEQFHQYLNRIDIRRLRVPWVSNAGAEVVEDPSRVADLLAGALAAPVRWTDGVALFGPLCGGRALEVGPGKVLSGLARRIAPDLLISPVGTVESLREYFGGP